MSEDTTKSESSNMPEGHSMLESHTFSRSNTISESSTASFSSIISESSPGSAANTILMADIASRGEASSGEVKEQLVDCMARRWASRTMFTTLTTENLETSSEFNVTSPDNESDCDSFLPGVDLKFLVENGIRERASDIALVKDCLMKMDDPAIGASVTELLDNDLAQIGLKEFGDDSYNANQKALALVRHRARECLKILPRSDNTEFLVNLHVLIDGHGGNYRVKDLFFSYNISWPLFLETLRRATEQSRIPPVDLLAQYYWPELQTPSSQDRLSSSFNMRSDRTIQGDTSSTNDVNLSTEFSQNLSTKLGYTLEHGPWLYQLFKARKGDMTLEKIEGKKILNSAMDFEAMKASLEEGSKKEPKEHRQVLIVHKLDREAQDRWKDIRDMEDLAEASFRDECREAEIDEEDIGVPYGRYLEELYSLCQKGLSQT